MPKWRWHWMPWCVAGVADLADRLAHVDAPADDECRIDRRQVTAVVAHAVVADERHREATAGCAVVHLRIPHVLRRNLRDRAGDR